jgi:hypothetical protein
MDTITPEAYAAAERDLLAILGRLLARDQEALEVFERGDVNWPGVVTLAINLLFTELDALGIDAAEWVERKQAEARARLATGERHRSSDAMRPFDEDG